MPRWGPQENKESALCIKWLRKCRCLPMSQTNFFSVYMKLAPTGKKARGRGRGESRLLSGWEWSQNCSRAHPLGTELGLWLLEEPVPGSGQCLLTRAVCVLPPATWRSQTSYPHSSPAHWDVPIVCNWPPPILLLSPFVHPVGTVWRPCLMLAHVRSVHPTFPHPAYHTQCSLALTLKKNFSP